MTMMVSLDWSPVDDVVHMIVKRRQPVSTGTQKDQARQEGVFMGLVEGLARGLASHGTWLRKDLIAPLMEHEDKKYVTALEYYVVQAWLREVVTRWDDKEWSDQSDDAFFLAMRSEFHELVYNHDGWYENHYESYRRRAVKAGVVPPTNEDRAWIEEELNTFKALANPLEQILAKVPAE